MIRITGPIDQIIMDEKVRFTKKTRKIDSVISISKVENTFDDSPQHNKENNNNESEKFAKVLEKNKRKFDEKV